MAIPRNRTKRGSIVAAARCGSLVWVNHGEVTRGRGQDTIVGDCVLWNVVARQGSRTKYFKAKRSAHSLWRTMINPYHPCSQPTQNHRHPSKLTLSASRATSWAGAKENQRNSGHPSYIVDVCDGRPGSDWSSLSHLNPATAGVQALSYSCFSRCLFVSLLVLSVFFCFFLSSFHFPVLNARISCQSFSFSLPHDASVAGNRQASPIFLPDSGTQLGCMWRCLVTFLMQSFISVGCMSVVGIVL